MFNFTLLLRNFFLVLLRDHVMDLKINENYNITLSCQPRMGHYLYCLDVFLAVQLYTIDCQHREVDDADHDGTWCSLSFRACFCAGLSEVCSNKVCCRSLYISPT